MYSAIEMRIAVGSQMPVHAYCAPTTIMHARSRGFPTMSTACPVSLAPRPEERWEERSVEA